MKTLAQDPIINAINNGIRQDIAIAVDTKCFRGAIILIYAGIDAMSHLSRPENQKYNEPEDFRNWVKKYFKIKGDTEVKPEEWWAARNAFLHTYTAYAKGHENTDVRVLGYMTNSIPRIRYNKSKNPNLVLVDVIGMRDAFFSGIDNFLTESFANETTRTLIEERLKELVLSIPITNPGEAI